MSIVKEWFRLSCEYFSKTSIVLYKEFFCITERKTDMLDIFEKKLDEDLYVAKTADDMGLTSNEAAQRLADDGENVLGTKRKKVL